MAESISRVTHLPKPDAYAELGAQVRAVLEGIEDQVTAMATVTSILHHGFGHLWTGFYRVVAPGQLLRVGPYQGSLGCLEIAFGQGVCGRAAQEKRTVVVDDVDAFEGHIRCDARARSEIVVPVFDSRGAVIAVLDIDSEHPAAFDDTDARALEELVAWFAESE